MFSSFVVGREPHFTLPPASPYFNVNKRSVSAGIKDIIKAKGLKFQHKDM